MSKLNNLSFIEKGAKAEQDFAKMVDDYLNGQDNLNKVLDDGTSIHIYRQNFSDRGIARFVNIYDDNIGWEFALYPIANLNDSNLAGLKCSRRTLSLPETISQFDSGDLELLKQFLSENLKN